jgi:hypothetical protein
MNEPLVPPVTQLTNMSAALARLTGDSVTDVEALTKIKQDLDALIASAAGDAELLRKREQWMITCGSIVMKVATTFRREKDYRRALSKRTGLSADERSVLCEVIAKADELMMQMDAEEAAS